MTVKVKPLVWAKHPSRNIWRCETAIGTYKVFGIGATTTWDFDSATSGTDRTTKPSTNIEEAKAAAQADYEARIISMLEHGTTANAAASRPVLRAWEERK